MEISKVLEPIVNVSNFNKFEGIGLHWPIMNIS
ncbi:hypothetical protein CCACVL1_10307 [Corchorus capsularis]|uniref:Uncharacterized protein n=1 Tax=Corchorus capsularis TaxID=210143 RepID=A0A1R3IRR4_COCAP|nr:hypothetical protein CCACVL1_10307 [Corchorus capsularis]